MFDRNGKRNMEMDVIVRREMETNDWLDPLCGDNRQKGLTNGVVLKMD